MQEQSVWFPFSYQNYKSGFGSCELYHQKSEKNFKCNFNTVLIESNSEIIFPLEISTSLDTLSPRVSHSLLTPWKSSKENQKDTALQNCPLSAYNRYNSFPGAVFPLSQKNEDGSSKDVWAHFPN